MDAIVLNIFNEYKAGKLAEELLIQQLKELGFSIQSVFMYAKQIVCLVCKEAVEAGTITFPEAIKRFSKVGVEEEEAKEYLIKGLSEEDKRYGLSDNSRYRYSSMSKCLFGKDNLSCQAGQPMVGFFWWNKENDGYKLVVVDAYHIGAMEEFSQKDHYVIWEELKKSGNVPADLDCRDIPRGRVEWDSGTRLFLVSTGEALPAKELKSLICSAFKLDGVRVDWLYNAHYDMEDMSDSIFEEDD